MMRTQLEIWMMIVLLAAMLASCGGTAQYDPRLVAADGLMYDHPDSALAILDSIHATDFIGHEANQAYHDLLITQARYINYYSFTSDTVINRALDYYKRHDDEREKLTRAYLYKGAVMNELHMPDSAMIYYKHAEAEAAPTDFFNQGYAKMSMGKLYHHHHAYDGRDIEKIEQALECFKRCNDSIYQLICLKQLGGFCRVTNPQKAEQALNQVMKIASQSGDKSMIIGTAHSLALMYFAQLDYRKAYQQLQRIKAIGLDGLSGQCYTTFAVVYAKLGMPDSAMYFLELAPKDFENDRSYSINYLEALSNIAKARGDSITYLKLENKCYALNAAEVADANILSIMYAENDFDQAHNNLLKEQRRQRNIVTIIIIAAIMLALIAMALYLYHKSHRYDKLILELKDRSQLQINELSGLQQNINQMQINDERLKGFISSHMGMMREMIEACYHEPNNRIAENMKRIVKFQDSNKDNWVKLYDYIDMEHNNIMTHTREHYPQLNDRDLLLLALSCMGFSYIQTAIIMGYSNATSVSVIKQRLARKMGLDCSLNEYIDSNGQVH